MNALTDLKNVRVIFNGTEEAHAQYRQLDIEYDEATRSLWTYMKPRGVACFSPGLLDELRKHDQHLQQHKGHFLFAGTPHPVDYAIGASRVPGIFNFGGDLALFLIVIRKRDREALQDYAYSCVNRLYARLNNFNCATTTISLIQGEALGGGFESALSSDVIVVEEHAKLGFPEILFNLFPGMGAYSLLTRRIGARKAEELMLSGKVFTALEMYHLGLVDVLAPTGEGEQTVKQFIAQHARHRNGMRAIYECRKHTHPISYQELKAIVDVWVEAALNLQEHDLKMMERLVRSQIQKNKRIQMASDAQIIQPETNILPPDSLEESVALS